MKASTTVSLDENLLTKARSIAKGERRTFSAQLEVWIEEKLDERGAAHLQAERFDAPDQEGGDA